MIVQYLACYQYAILMNQSMNHCLASQPTSIITWIRHLRNRKKCLFHNEEHLHYGLPCTMGQIYKTCRKKLDKMLVHFNALFTIPSLGQEQTKQVKFKLVSYYLHHHYPLALNLFKRSCIPALIPVDVSSSTLPVIPSSLYPTSTTKWHSII